MSATKSLLDLSNKVVYLSIDGSATKYKILAFDLAAGFVKVQDAESENPSTNWLPLRRIDNVEEQE